MAELNLKFILQESAFILNEVRYWRSLAYQLGQ